MTRSPLVQISVTDHVRCDVTLAQSSERNTRPASFIRVGYVMTVNTRDHTKRVQALAETKVGSKGAIEVG